MDRRDRIEAVLRERFSPEHLAVIDESHRHAGHAGAASGGGHFTVVIVSAAFRDQSRLERQRAIYTILGDAMWAEIHALALRALTPEEWAAAHDRA
jgi:BolA family transcriptional regulator, general stress-responsive regulator